MSMNAMRLWSNLRVEKGSVRTMKDDIFKPHWYSQNKLSILNTNCYDMDMIVIDIDLQVLKCPLPFSHDNYKRM